METHQGEAFLGAKDGNPPGRSVPRSEAGWTPQGGEGELLCGAPLPPRSAKPAVSRQPGPGSVEQRDPPSRIPHGAPTAAAGAGPAGGRGPEPGWPAMAGRVAELAGAKGIQQRLQQKVVELSHFCNIAQLWQVSYHAA